MLKELNQAPWRKKMLARIGDICTGYGKGGGHVFGILDGVHLRHSFIPSSQFPVQ